jgi:cytoskeleton protein RodZ
MARGNFGERLKRERELREVTINELTVATRVSTRFLEALENEQWDQLPGGVFNRGFVRAVARYLGLGEEDLLAEYDLARGAPSLPAAPPGESQIPRPPLWIPIAALVGVLVIVAGLIAGGIYGWRRYAAHRAAKKSSSSTALPAQAQQATGATAPAGTAAPAPDPAAAPGTAQDSVPLDLSVSASEATRVRIVGDGAVLLDAELPAGETKHFSASKEFQVSASDSSAVLLELNGRAMPPIGAPGASGTIVLGQKDLRQAPGGTP